MRRSLGVHVCKFTVLPNGSVVPKSHESRRYDVLALPVTRQMCTLDDALQAFFFGYTEHTEEDGSRDVYRIAGAQKHLLIGLDRTQA